MSSAILLQTSLEAIDKPFIPAQPAASGSSSSSSSAGSGSTGLTPPASPPKGRRISPLPPMPTIPRAAGSSSKGPQRYLFIAVRRGHRPGVYTEWTQAEVQLSNHPDPHYKTFSTRLAAEAFVAGWDGAGRHSLPRSSPRTLREHLAMSFPNSVASPSSTSRRQSYHERILAAQAFGTDERHLDGLAISGMSASATAQAGRSQSFRYSQVKVSSPLRMQVGDDDSDGPSGPEGAMRRVQSYMGLGGLLSPPLSPTDKQVSVMDRQRPTRPRDVSEGAPWSARSHREFRKPSGKATGLLSPPDSPVLGPGGADVAGAARGSQPPPPSGLWADCKPATSSPLSPLALGPPVDLLGGANPKKFSRSGLKKSGVIMPVAAPRTPSSSSLTTLGSLSLSKRASQSSLFSASNSSLVSLASTSGAGDRSRTMPRKQQSTPSFRGASLSSQDRLGSLAETSRRELQADEHGVLALEPPRPSFMGMRRQQSNSSLDSTSSAQSLCSLTSGTSAPSSPAASDAGSDDCSRGGGGGGGQYFGRPITAEPGLQVHELAEIPETHEVLAFDHIISCTKSDGDADGSSEGGSVKSGATGSFAKREKKSGGLFKRFSKALKLDKKTVAGQDNGRRPSV